MDILDDAEKILENDRDVIVPVQRLWELSCKTYSGTPLSIKEFSEALAGDDRFEFFHAAWPALGDPEPPKSGAAGEVSDPENLDYVKLRRVKITPGLLAGVMSMKVDTAIEALVQAWNQRPSGDRETEDQLTQILLQARKLREDLQELMRDEERQKKKNE